VKQLCFSAINEHQFVLFVQPKEREGSLDRLSVWSRRSEGIIWAAEAYLISELDEKLPQYLWKADRIYYHLGRDRAFNESAQAPLNGNLC